MIIVACTPGEEPLNDDETTDDDVVNMDEVINFPDPHLLACVKSHAYISAEEPVRIKDVKNLTFLECISAGITDLTGLEKMPWMVELQFNGNPITSIEPLRNTIDIEYLNIGGGGVSDIDPLRGKNKIKTLNLAQNLKIKEISSLKELLSLEVLYLSDNEIRDIGPLSNLTNLDTLYLRENQIKDISSLQKLTKLRILTIEDNCIADFAIIDYLKEKGMLEGVAGATAEEQDYARCE